MTKISLQNFKDIANASWFGNNEITLREDGNIHDRGFFKSRLYPTSQNCYKATREFITLLKETQGKDILALAAKELGDVDFSKIEDIKKPLKMCQVKNIMAKIGEIETYRDTKLLIGMDHLPSQSLYSRAYKGNDHALNSLNKLANLLRQGEKLPENARDLMGKIFSAFKEIMGSHNIDTEVGKKAISMISEEFQKLVDHPDSAPSKVLTASLDEIIQLAKNELAPSEEPNAGAVQANNVEKPQGNQVPLTRENVLSDMKGKMSFLAPTNFQPSKDSMTMLNELADLLCAIKDNDTYEKILDEISKSPKTDLLKGAQDTDTFDSGMSRLFTLVSKTIKKYTKASSNNANAGAIQANNVDKPQEGQVPRTNEKVQNDLKAKSPLLSESTFDKADEAKQIFEEIVTTLSKIEDNATYDKILTNIGKSNNILNAINNAEGDAESLKEALEGLKSKVSKLIDKAGKGSNKVDTVPSNASEKPNTGAIQANNIDAPQRKQTPLTREQVIKDMKEKCPLLFDGFSKLSKKFQPILTKLTDMCLNFKYNNTYLRVLKHINEYSTWKNLLYSAKNAENAKNADDIDDCLKRLNYEVDSSLPRQFNTYESIKGLLAKQLPSVVNSPFFGRSDSYNTEEFLDNYAENLSYTHTGHKWFDAKMLEDTIQKIGRETSKYFEGIQNAKNQDDYDDIAYDLIGTISEIVIEAQRPKIEYLRTKEEVENSLREKFNILFTCPAANVQQSVHLRDRMIDELRQIKDKAQYERCINNMVNSAPFKVIQHFENTNCNPNPDDKEAVISRNIAVSFCGDAVSTLFNGVNDALRNPTYTPKFASYPQGYAKFINEGSL